MTNRTKIAFMSVAVAVVATVVTLKFPAGNERRLKIDPEELEEERQELLRKQKRFDEPDAAMAYYVNRRTGGWVQNATGRGVDPVKIGMPLDSSLYASAIQQSKMNARYSTAAGGAVLPSEANAPAGGTLQGWSPLGPSNQGGRTRQLLIHPTNPSIMYAAAVAGGVWKTTDGGATWNALTDLALPNIAVNSLAFDPTNPNKIYAGTGEGFGNFDAIRGLGIYVTTDAGATWAALPSTVSTLGTVGNFSFVNDIVVSPRNPQRIYAATNNGVFRSIDGGTTWSAAINAVTTGGCTDLALQMNRAVGFLFAACGRSTTTGSIQRMVDANTGTLTTVFTTTNQSRSSLAIAPSNESIVYALVSGGASSANSSVVGVFRSTANGGSGSWTTQMAHSGSNVDPVPINNILLTNPRFAYTACVGSSRGLFNQGWYDQVITVDPADSNRVWVGGIDLFRSDDGGQNFGAASYWWAEMGDPLYAHADQHVIAFHPQYNGTTNKTMFVANDGGIFRTSDARAGLATTVDQICGFSVAPNQTTWTELNTNYITTQFYHGIAFPNGNTYMGGTQDNGTWQGTTASTVATRIFGGDGGYVAYDPATDTRFLETTRLSIRRSVAGGAFASAISGIAESSANFQFINPFHMNPGNRQHLWTGGFFIWRTINQASSWTQASALTPGNGNVTAIAASSADTNKVIFGMSDGFIGFNTAALSATNTTSWSNTQPRSNVSVTALAWDPSNSNNAWATYGTFSGISVYRSTNSGATWTARPGTAPNVLPAVPATAVAVDPTDSNRVYVGTDIGVYTTVDGGLNWFKEVTGFANVPVEWLEFNATGTVRLYAFTHGRGVWRVNLVP